MKLKVKGDIIPNDYKFIYDWIGWEHCCPSDAETAVDACADGETLEVEISSGGGYVHAGAEIYTAIRGYRKGDVRIAVTGLAASAASVIAMAGYCEMSPAALMMIHNVSCSASGDYRDMEQAAEILRENNDALITAYAAKTGRSHDELQRLMDAETWMSANRAVELGTERGIRHAADHHSHRRRRSYCLCGRDRCLREDQVRLSERRGGVCAERDHLGRAGEPLRRKRQTALYSRCERGRCRQALRPHGKVGRIRSVRRHADRQLCPRVCVQREPGYFRFHGGAR